MVRSAERTEVYRGLLLPLGPGPGVEAVEVEAETGGGEDLGASWRWTFNRVVTRSSGYVAAVAIAVPVAPERAWVSASEDMTALYVGYGPGQEAVNPKVDQRREEGQRSR